MPKHRPHVSRKKVDAAFSKVTREERRKPKSKRLTRKQIAGKSFGKARQKK